MKTTIKAVHKTIVRADDKQVAMLFGKLSKNSVMHDVLKKSAIIAEISEKGVSPKKIARQIGCKEATVYNMCKLNSLPSKVKKYIANGDINPTHAVDRSRNMDSDEKIIRSVEKFIHAKNKNNASLVLTKVPTQKTKIIDFVKERFGNLSKSRFDFAVDIVKKLAHN